MKLIIQIPCHNEEKTLPITLKDLPRKIEGVDEIEVLVIDDGSVDNTQTVARENGVVNIVSLVQRRGLAEAFKKGIDRALELGADIIVNTDGDNQYKGEDIPRLIRPILNRKAEIVIGCRDMATVKHFSIAKKILQKFGSFIVRKFSRTEVPDTTSGFRAYSREAALRLNIFSSYTYTLETIIQAGRQGIAIAHIDITTNKKLRESRLISSIPIYIWRSIVTMLRIYLMYEPLKSFIKLGLLPIIFGVILIIRFLIAHFTQPVGGHVQSLIIAAIFIITGFGIMMIGLLGDIISANRRLNEEVLYRLKKNKLIA
jgi:glycosyltransferase involved in cell wall biosynthesis